MTANFGKSSKTLLRKDDDAMENTMTPSTEIKGMTEGQIDKAVANYRAMLTKYASEMDSQAVQAVLGQSELANEQLAVFRRRVEAINEMVVRRVKVNRDRQPMEAIKATKRSEYLKDEVVYEMPRGTLEEVEVCFFPLKKFTSAVDVQKMLEDCGLEPDPYALAAVNEEDPYFADSHPNGIQWYSNSYYYYLAFGGWNNRHSVYCHYDEGGWSGDWWFGGVRKQS